MMNVWGQYQHLSGNYFNRLAYGLDRKLAGDDLNYDDALCYVVPKGTAFFENKRGYSECMSLVNCRMSVAMLARQRFL